jgi:hypothetical protein
MNWPIPNGWFHHILDLVLHKTILEATAQICCSQSTLPGQSFFHVEVGVPLKCHSQLCYIQHPHPQAAGACWMARPLWLMFGCDPAPRMHLKAVTGPWRMAWAMWDIWPPGSWSSFEDTQQVFRIFIFLGAVLLPIWVSLEQFISAGWDEFTIGPCEVLRGFWDRQVGYPVSVKSWKAWCKLEDLIFGFWFL